MAGPVIISSGSGVTLTNPVWHPDVTPSGLDSSSWSRDQTVPSFSYLTDETGTVTSDDYGLLQGTIIQDFNPFIALPSGDCSLTVRIAADIPGGLTGTHNPGCFVGNLAGESSSTFDGYQFHSNFVNTNEGYLYVRRWDNGSVAATEQNLRPSGRLVGGIYRIGVNSARTEANFYFSQDNGRCFMLLDSITPAFDLNSWGPTLYSSSNTYRCAWMRVRTGTDEHQNIAPEGGFLG